MAIGPAAGPAIPLPSQPPQQQPQPPQQQVQQAPQQQPQPPQQQVQQPPQQQVQQPPQQQAQQDPKMQALQSLINQIATKLGKPTNEIEQLLDADFSKRELSELANEAVKSIPQGMKKFEGMMQAKQQAHQGAAPNTPPPPPIGPDTKVFSTPCGSVKNHKGTAYSIDLSFIDPKTGKAVENLEITPDLIYKTQQIISVIYYELNRLRIRNGLSQITDFSRILIIGENIYLDKKEMIVNGRVITTKDLKITDENKLLTNLKDLLEHNEDFDGRPLIEKTATSITAAILIISVNCIFHKKCEESYARKKDLAIEPEPVPSADPRDYKRDETIQSTPEVSSKPGNPYNPLNWFRSPKKRPKTRAEREAEERLKPLRIYNKHAATESQNTEIPQPSAPSLEILNLLTPTGVLSDQELQGIVKGNLTENDIHNITSNNSAFNTVYRKKMIDSLINEYGTERLNRSYDQLQGLLNELDQETDPEKRKELVNVIENLIITTANQLLSTCKERLNKSSQPSQLLHEINEKLENAYFDTIQQLFKKPLGITALEFSNKMTRALPKFLFQVDINHDPSIDGDDRIKGGLAELDKDNDNPEIEKLYWTRNIPEDETA